MRSEHNRAIKRIAVEKRHRRLTANTAKINDYNYYGNKVDRSTAAERIINAVDIVLRMANTHDGLLVITIN